MSSSSFQSAREAHRSPSVVETDAATSSQSGPEAQSTRPADRPDPLRQFLRDFVRALAVFAVCAMIYAWWTAGSLRHITDVLQGQRIVLDPPAIPALLATPGELVQVPLRICNLTRSPIKVTGASANCSCVRPGDLPVDIAPHGEVIINLSWHVPAELGQAQESIQYYFSQDETWSQPVTLVADVVASDDGAAGL